MTILKNYHWCSQPKCYNHAWRQIGGKWICEECYAAAQSQTAVCSESNAPDPFQGWKDYFGQKAVK